MIKFVLKNASIHIFHFLLISLSIKAHPSGFDRDRTKDIAFQIAGREAFKQAYADAKPVLQEPIMDVSVTIPETMMGDVMSDLTTRRGRVQGMDSEGRKSIINAQVPLSEMLRYGTDLRSMTGGRGLYTMTFSHYEKVPANVQEDVIAQSKVAEQA